MSWKSQDIIDSFNGIIRDAKNLNSEELDSKYADFKETYEKLYSVAIDSVATGTVQKAYSILQMMIRARDDLQSGKTSKLHTDVFVGNELGKEYIYPVTNTPSLDDYKIAIEQIKEKIKENEENDRKEELASNSN